MRACTALMSRPTTRHRHLDCMYLTVLSRAHDCLIAATRTGLASRRSIDPATMSSGALSMPESFREHRHGKYISYTHIRCHQYKTKHTHNPTTRTHALKPHSIT